MKGEEIRTALKGGAKIQNSVVSYRYAGDRLVCTNRFTQESWTATHSVEELVRSGREYRTA